jgi:hypothetical protein
MHLKFIKYLKKIVFILFYKFICKICSRQDKAEILLKLLLNTQSIYIIILGRKVTYLKFYE